MTSHREQFYTCPMHPEVEQEREGLCSVCGMRLVIASKKRDSGHSRRDFNKHEGHSLNVFRNKFWISLVLSVPVVLYSEIVAKLFNYQAPRFFGSEYLPFILASIIFFYGGWVFIASAYRELLARLPGMMTLIALAISVAYAYSVAVTFFGGGETLYWELATLITVMLLGHWLEMRAVSGAQSALKELAKLLPDKAEVIRRGKTETISLQEVRKGDIVLVKPGSKIPTDGLIKEGVSDVNESIVTGESKPVSKKQGDEVIAGAINGDGSLKIEVTKIGDDTFLAGVMRLVADAQASKSRLQMLSDRAAYYLTIIAVVAGGVTLAAWLALSDAAFAINRMVAVLVIACPHALGLAIPLVASISTAKAAQNGFLVRERLALEAARDIDMVLFDKTGTLTKGEFGVDRIVVDASADQPEALRLAASVENHSEHPIAKAIVKQALKQNLNLEQAKNFKRIPGKGAQAELKGDKVILGSHLLLDELAVQIAKPAFSQIEALERQGKTIVHVIKNQTWQGAIAFSDVIRDESKAALRDLQSLGVKTAMITGDSEDVAAWVARELGIDEYFARVLPGEKAEKVKLLQSKGLKVAMVGDGLNDAPALTQADLGIAIGAGTNVAIESAGIILVKNDPRDITKILKLSRLTYAKMIQNLFWATGYNVAAIPLAAGVLASRGVLFEPALAALLMSLSTVIVALNAMTLKKVELD